MFAKFISTTLKIQFLRNLECQLCRQHINNIQKLRFSTKIVAAPISSIPTKSSKSSAAPSNDEKLFILSQNDPDQFGSTKIHHISDEAEDEGDKIEEEFIQNKPRNSQKLTTKQYADLIKDHLQNKRVKEAIDVLEIRMIKEDHVKPENYIFNLLIGGCARVGYSKKAFSLYTRMKQRNLKVTGGTYTSLFNACATAPWSQDSLNKANHLREVMLEKGYEPNASNYNAMIKAYGRCGDIKTAFELVDEMKKKKVDVQLATLNFLLQACASDKEYGFRHALLVWRKIFSRKLVPDIYSYNLLLRCVRDCGIGDLETLEDVIKQILLQSQNPNEQKVLESNEDTLMISNVNELKDGNSNGSIPSVTQEHEVNATPNLISKHPHLGTLVSLSEIKKSEDRLLLIGGTAGFLREMEWAKVQPTIKTFTALLDVIPSTFSAEKFIIATIRRLHIKCDIDFFNILIKKRSMRKDYEGAKAVLSMIKTASLQPDIVTYGVLALGCTTKDDARQLLQEMFDKGLRMNIEILGAMLKSGCIERNFDYVREIMRIVKTEKIKPNEEFLTHLYTFSHHCADMLKRKHKYAREEHFYRDFKNFHDHLGKWRTQMGLHDLKLEEAVEIVREHPWEQFKYSQPDGIEAVKNPKKRREKKLTRHIQRIKPDKLVDTTNVFKENKMQTEDVKVLS